MKLDKKIIFDLIFILIFFIFVWSSYYNFEDKGFVITPEEYTITEVYSYHGRHSIKYRVNITYEKDGIKYTPHCYINKNEFKIVKYYFDNISEQATKNYLGNIKVYKNMDFTILKNEKNN